MNNKQNRNAVLKSKQSGLSLIELMISMVIGLFLLVGVVSNFISNTNSDIKRDAVSEMDANAAEALRILRNAISHAGYRSIENTRLENDMAFYVVGESDVTSPNCTASITRDINPIETAVQTRDTSTNDFLTIISLADNPLDSAGNINSNALVYSDCTGGGANRDARSVACSTDPNSGMSNPTDAKIYNWFSLTRDGSSEDRTLYCGGNRGEEEAIAKDVETIQFLYGVTNEAGNTTFRNATQVSAADPDQWPMVTSVQVGLLMRSSNQYVLDTASSKSTYYVLDQEITIANSDLRRLFRIYTTTINLENKNTDVIQ